MEWCSNEHHCSYIKLNSPILLDDTEEIYISSVKRFTVIHRLKWNRSICLTQTHKYKLVLAYAFNRYRYRICEAVCLYVSLARKVFKYEVNEREPSPPLHQRVPCSSIYLYIQSAAFEWRRASVYRSFSAFNIILRWIKQNHMKSWHEIASAAYKTDNIWFYSFYVHIFSSFGTFLHRTELTWILSASFYCCSWLTCNQKSAYFQADIDF